MSNENLTSEIMALLEARPNPSITAHEAAMAKRDEIRTGIIEYFVEVEGGYEEIMQSLLEHLGMDKYNPIKKWRVEVDAHGATFELEGVEAKTEEEAIEMVAEALEWEEPEVEVTVQARVGEAWGSDSAYIDISYLLDFDNADIHAYEM